MADKMVEANRTCPKCLSDNVEKVGWNYWYCGECTNIWQLIAASGPSSLRPRVLSPIEEDAKRLDAGRGKNTSKHSKDGKFKRSQTPEEKARRQLPEPGTLKTSEGIDYPL